MKYLIEEKEKDRSGSKFDVNIELPIENGWYDNVELVVFDDDFMTSFPLKHYANNEKSVKFRGQVHLNNKYLYHYAFRYKVNGNIKYAYGEKYDLDSCDLINSSKLSVGRCHTSDEFKNKIIYHIPCIDRFYKHSDEYFKEMPRRHLHKSFDEKIQNGPDEDGVYCNDFYGGTIKGVTEKLDYISSLGVDVLYLGPLTESYEYHHYGTQNYMKLDSMLGKPEDLAELCDEAHKRGIKVIVDFAFNHVNKYADYFEEKDGEMEPREEYKDYFRKVWNPYTNKLEYENWYGIDTMVKNNGPKVWDYICEEVIPYWMSLGIDGFRLDVIENLPHDAIVRICRKIKEINPDAYILSEIWEALHMKDKAIIENTDGAQNYYLTENLLRYEHYNEVDRFGFSIDDIIKHYPDNVIASSTLHTSTQDTSRGVNLHNTSYLDRNGQKFYDTKKRNIDYDGVILEGNEYDEAKKRYFNYLFSIYSLPGNVCINAGDERGLQGVGNIQCRAPMNWNDYDEEILEYFKYLAKMKKDINCTNSNLRIKNLDANYFAFNQFYKDGSTLTLVNNTDKDIEYDIPEEYSNCEKVYTLKSPKKGVLSPYGGITFIR